MIIRILRKIFRNKTLITTFTKSFDDHYGPNRFLNTLLNISGGEIRKNRILAKCILFISPNKFSRLIPFFKLLGYKIIYRIDGIILFNNELMSKSLKIKNANPRKIKINNQILNILKKAMQLFIKVYFVKILLNIFSQRQSL